MKKKVLVSAVALLTSFLAVGCSNSGASKNAGSSTYKVHKTSKKNNQKSNSQDSSSKNSNSSSVENSDSSASSSTSSNEEASKSSATNEASSSSSTESSDKSNVKSSNSENSSSAAQSSNSDKSSASAQSSSTQATSSDNISESDFQTVVNDTIKRNKYPSGTTVKDFSVMQSGNQIDVAEKKTGAIIAHYTVKNGHLYYYDVVTDQQEQVK